MREPHPEPTGIQRRANTIYETIRARICTSRYPPGRTLREGDLADEFGVSRSPIRRVLAKLEEAKLLEVKHGVGAQVTEIRPEAYVAACEVRMLLAMHSGPYFTDPFPTDAPAFFKDCRGKFLALEAGDLHAFADVNNLFFVGALNLIENSYLREIEMNVFFETARMWLVKLPELDWDSTVQDIAREIDEVIRAIEGRDPVGLGLVLRNSIHAALRRFQEPESGAAPGSGDWRPAPWPDHTSG